jgi:hypothetical protein
MAMTVVSLAGTAVPARAAATDVLPRQQFQGLLDELVTAGMPGAIGLVRHDAPHVDRRQRSRIAGPRSADAYG